MVRTLSLSLFFIVSLSNLFFAQSNKFLLDTEFNTFELPAGKNYTSGTIDFTRVQSDGKILLIYQTGGYGIIDNYYKITRIDVNNFLDENFTSEIFNGAVKDVALQSDGKIIVAGNFTTYGTATAKKLVRLNTDGTLDPTFNTGIGFQFGQFSQETTRLIKNVKVQSDDKILVCGDIVKYQGVARNNVVRINPDGQLDESFNLDPKVNYIEKIRLLPDGNILLARSSELQKVSNNGTIDSNFLNFQTEVPNSISITEVVPVADGSIYVGGEIYTNSGLGIVDRNYIVKLTKDGENDYSFYTEKFTSTVGSSGIKSMYLQDDKKLVVTGSFSSFNSNYLLMGIVRINPDKTVDNSFVGRFPKQDTPLVNQVVPIQGNRLLFVGSFGIFNNETVTSLMKLDMNGNIDSSLKNICKGFDGTVSHIFPQNDGKFIVTGRFLAYNGISLYKIARINADGSLDTTFNVPTRKFIEPQENYQQIITLDDGKLLAVSGGSRYYNETQSLIGGSLVRLNQDGSFDESFINNNSTYRGAWGNLNSVFVRNDKTIVIPNARRYNDLPAIDGKILVLNEDGSFNRLVDMPPSVGTILRIEGLSDGKMIILSWINSTTNKLMRLMPDFSVDTSFTADPSLAKITNFKLLPNGQIIAFSNLPATNKMYRLNENGSLNTSIAVISFSTPSSSASTFDPLSYNEGDNTFYTAQNAYKNLQKHNADGSIDTSFDIGLGFKTNSELVRSIKHLDNDIIMVGGAFVTFDGKPVRNFAKLKRAAYLNNHEYSGDNLTKIFPNPVSDLIYLREKYNSYEVYDYHGRLLMKNSYTKAIDVSNLKQGNYVLVLQLDNLKKTHLFIKK